MQMFCIVLFLFVDDALSEKVDIKNKTKQTIRHNQIMELTEILIC